MLKEIKFLVEMCPIYFVLFILLCCCCGENNNNVAAAGTASVAYKTRNFDTQNSYNNDLNYNNYNYNNNNNNNNININKTTTKFYQNYSPNSNGCSSDRLVVYKVVLHTYWTRELFPKHYPDWRPPAQWTKTIGRAHDSSFSIYHIGQPASAGVKQFAEIGKTDIFDNQKQQEHTSIRHNENNIFDEFDIPAIMSGSGRNEAKFFVDGNHSLVSLMTRIVPSPDWFIGVDSFQLCIGGSWLDSVTVELDPLDAGTDNGFTFTAPNWPTDPQGVIYHITSRYPGHPAGSFFYPKSKRLPPIATFQFIKLKEYELSEVFNFEEDERKYDMVKTKTHLETEHNHVEMNNELSASIEKERQNEVTVIPIGNTKRERIRARLLAKMNPSINNMTTFEYSNVIPKNDKNALIGNIANNYATMKHSRKRILRPPRDCRVGHWSDWEACSKTCGIGEMHRHRKVIKYAKRGGRPCPPLKESKWCGTAKGCHSPSTYFNWSNT